MMTTKRGRLRIEGWTTGAYVTRVVDSNDHVAMPDILVIVAMSFSTTTGQPLALPPQLVRIAFTEALLKVNVDWGFGDYLGIEGDVTEYRSVRPSQLKQYWRMMHRWRKLLMTKTGQFLKENGVVGNPEWVSLSRQINKMVADNVATKMSFARLIHDEQLLLKKIPQSAVRSGITALIVKQLELRLATEKGFDGLFNLDYSPRYLGHEIASGRSESNVWSVANTD